MNWVEKTVSNMFWGYLKRMNNIRDRAVTRCKFCNSDDVVRNGHRKGTQYWLCKNCGRGFVDNLALPRSKYPVEAVASALYLYFTGSSLNDIRRHTEQHYKVLPSDSTVYGWVRKYTDIANKSIKDLKPDVGDTFIADETVIKISGKNFWLWDIICPKTRYLLATYLSPNRGKKEAQILMERAAKKAGKVPKVVITDALRSYLDGIEMAFGADTRHIQASPFSGTQLIERWHGTLKERTKVVWGLKKPDTAVQFLDGFLFYYNYLRPHESLDDKTPAEAAGLQPPYKTWLEVVKGQSPIEAERHNQGISTDEQEFVIEYPPKPYRKRKKSKKRAQKAKDKIPPSLEGIRL
ncbi:transposase [Chloroflexota bacterium]